MRGFKMTVLSEKKRKLVAKTTEHVERALRVVDACLVDIFNAPPMWNSRTIRSTGIITDTQKINHALRPLSAVVTITGKAEPKNTGMFLNNIAATVEFAGNQEYHDPSGTVVNNLNRIVKVHILIICEGSNNYIFTEKQISQNAC